MPFYVCLFVINLGTNYEHVQKYVVFPTGRVNFSSLDQGSNCILSPWHLVITLPFNLVITCIFLLKCNKIDLHEKILLLIEKFQTEKYCFHFINYLMLWPEICHLYWKIWEFWGKHQSSLYLFLTSNLHTRCIRLYHMAFMTRPNTSLRFWIPLHV